MTRKVAFFLPNLNLGGAQKVTLNIIEAIINEDIKVELIVSNCSGELKSNLNKNISLIDLNSSKTIYSLFKLARYIRYEKPSVIISVMNYVNIIAILAKYISLTQVPIIFTEHSTISTQLSKNKLKNRVLIKLSKLLYKKSNKIIAVSDGVRDDLIEFLNLKSDKVTTIYNPIINEELYKKSNEIATEEWIYNKNRPLILSVGRLAEEKDFTTLIKAFDIVNKKVESNLIILGEGYERTNLEKLINHLNLESRVKLQGFISNPYPYMKNADVFVLSSTREGLPGVLIEALALNTKIVSTNCKSGPKEILLDGKLGKLVEIKNELNMAEAILESLNNKISPNNEEFIDKYKFENIAIRYRDEINKVLNK